MYTRLCALRSKFVAVACIALLAGCASSIPKATPDGSVAAPYHIRVNDRPTVSMESEGSVQIMPDEKEHLKGLVVLKLDKLRSFNPADGDPKDCMIVVDMTRFDKGNAFARAMLAGLGQIHLAANVTVTDPAGTRLQAFKVEKTFAWGGIYGGTTRIDDVEPAFAEAIAAQLTGQSIEPADAKRAQKATPPTN